MLKLYTAPCQTVIARMLINTYCGLGYDKTCHYLSD